MLNKLVAGFVHRAGVHCESSSLRDIFEFYGFKFSEPIVFGLDSRLGFVYWHSKPTPYPFVGGRARDLDKNLCANLGVTIRVNKTSSRVKAYESLKKLINRDIPVMIILEPSLIPSFSANDFSDRPADMSKASINL